MLTSVASNQRSEFVLSLDELPASCCSAWMKCQIQELLLHVPLFSQLKQVSEGEDDTVSHSLKNV